MRVSLLSFQVKMVRSLRMNLSEAQGSYQRTKTPQVISMQAPTGAGKTIMMAALIESVYAGYNANDGLVFEEQPNAIFVWLSDSPELNEQSKDKIEYKTTKLVLGQCETITEESFDKEMLEDGRIYFLNTQKIGRSGNLTKHSDHRQYTIWETLENTIREKSDHLFFIIDEAHRGAKTKEQSGKDTTIMQRFIKGYHYSDESGKHHMRPMPVVIGMSATAARFNELIGNTNSTLYKCVTTADEVRSSGLLKDRIVITYPDDPTRNNDMVLLEAATEEWDKKCRHWKQYCSEQKSARVDPVFVIQVCPGSGKRISETNLDDVIAKVEEKLGGRFSDGEVVHCFGSETTLNINGLVIPHVNASEIVDNHKIKVVLFKEALSTGWDCPRAETMMSFRRAADATYIAQLLGRMIRTPLQSRILRDDFLNDVKLYLPYFDKDTVLEVVNELQNAEGGEIPTQINGESLAEPVYINWTVHTRKPKAQQPHPSQLTMKEFLEISQENPGGTTINIPAPTNNIPVTMVVPAVHEENSSARESTPAAVTVNSVQTPIEEQQTLILEIDRQGVIKFINEQCFLTYSVRQERINDYLKSLLDLVTLLVAEGIYQNGHAKIKNDVVKMIREYIEQLQSNGTYNEFAKNVLQFKLSVQVFDVFGKAINNNEDDEILLLSETDLDRQLRKANLKMGAYGFPNAYAKLYYDEDNPNMSKIDCILFAADEACMEKLFAYAKQKFYELTSSQDYRRQIANSSESCKKKYHDILADGSKVSEQIFSIPENIVVREDPNGIDYYNHLLAREENGIAKIKLNGWESELIEAESQRPDFVCWLRNPSRVLWALCLPYEIGGEQKSFYPDFIIVRKAPDSGYILDILEPHGKQYADNLAKAKALAKYAKDEIRFGRIQLIHKSVNAMGQSQFNRLNLTEYGIRERVLRANNDDELKNIFSQDGVIE
ncbi:MAG: DEAD/DEAH box helicase family protein [Thermoguttaceae bacterium]|nr:DEAD/DEAH box helicase family protein [Thermoguttaceae bacterium]